MDEKTILTAGFKLIGEAFDWTEEENEAAYRDFYNYVSGVSILTELLIRKLDEKEN